MAATTARAPMPGSALLHAAVPRLSAPRVPSLLLLHRRRPRAAELEWPRAQRPFAVAAAAAAKGGGGKEKKRSSSSSSKRPPARPGPAAAADDDDDDGVTLIPGDDDDVEEGEDEDDDDDDGWFEDIDGDDDDDGGLLAAGNDDDDDAALADPSKRVSAEGASWGPAALEAARRVLAEEPDLNGGGGGGGGEAGGGDDGDVSLYAFRILNGGQRVDVRLDSARDRYGSPTMVQIEAFARAFNAALEHAAGAEAAADVAVEVSSPGAERRLALPADLRRFAALPLRVDYLAAPWSSGEDGGGGGGGGGGGAKRAVQTAILRILDDGSGPIVIDGEEEEADEAEPRRRRPKKQGGAEEKDEAPVVAADTTLWRLADVKANAPTKGRGLTRKQRDQRLRIPLADLVSVRIHVEF